jgi:hypothetical protein
LYNLENGKPFQPIIPCMQMGTINYTYVLYKVKGEYQLFSGSGKRQSNFLAKDGDLEKLVNNYITSEFRDKVKEAGKRLKHGQSKTFNFSMMG